MVLSVITAVRNALSSCGKESLVRCLNSVAALDVDHEHIVQDGLSDDGTAMFLDSFPNNGISVNHEKDNGIYNALNKGLKKARGEWIYILGADDYVLSPSVLKETLQKGAKEGASIVASPVFINRGSSFSSMIQCRPKHLLCTMPFPHQGILMRKSVMDELGGFDERFSVSSDYHLIFRAILSLRAKVTLTHEAYSVYGLNGFSTGNNRIVGENRAFLGEYFALTGREADDLVTRKLLPANRILKLLFHCSPLVRCAARYHTLRYLFDRVGMIGSDGALKYKSRRYL